MRLIFLKLAVVAGGNTNKLGNAGMCNWKSSLFFLTGFISLNGLSKARDIYLAEQFTIELSVMLITALENLSKQSKHARSYP